MQFALRPLALAASVAIAGAAPPDALTVVAAANGHAAAVHLRATATRVYEGRTIDTTLDQLGPTRLLRRCIAGVCAGTWFDGRRSWTYGLNETVLPEAVDDAVVAQRTLAAIASYAFAEPAFTADGGRVAAAGPNRWRVRARDGAELIAVLDPGTHALTAVEDAGGQRIARYARQARAGDATFALERDGPFEPGSYDAVTAVAGPLAPPAGVQVSFGDAPAAMLAGDPVPVVGCSIAGRPERCLLDTGATPSAVTLPVAEALRLEPHGELELAGIGRLATGFVETGPLTLGGARFERARFAVVPATNAVPFDVVVGSDLLARVRLVLDRRARTARVSAPVAEPRRPGAIALTFRAGSPMVQATFGSSGAEALLDTGDQSVLSIGYGTYREGPQWPVLSREQAVGMAGADDVLTVAVPEVRVGPVDLGTTRTAVRRTQTTAHVGVGLWDRYVVTVDETGESLTLEPVR